MKRLFYKSFATNYLSVEVSAVDDVYWVCPELIKSIGFFALSGAITNWLAVFVLV